MSAFIKTWDRIPTSQVTNPVYFRSGGYVETRTGSALDLCLRVPKSRGEPWTIPEVDFTRLAESSEGCPS